MARLTRNLRLRVGDSLTTDAVYNLDRIDLLGDVFPLGSTDDLTIQSSGNIILSPSGTVTLGGDTTIGGSLTLPSGQYSTTIQTSTQSSNITLTLPGNTGNSGQFLSTNGTGTLSWADPPTSNFSSLNDTLFTNLTAGEVAQYDGTRWVNISLPGTTQSGTFTWSAGDGVSKSITHNFNSVNIIYQIYDSTAKCQVFPDTVDYLDNDTIVITVDETPVNDYTIFLQQVT